MANACAAVTAEMQLVEGLLTSVDCNVSAIVTSGYGAMMGPGSQMLIGLTALLTIYVAVLGLRLMLGFGSLRVGDLTITLVKIGAVLALATNWPLYQQLVFNTFFHGPEQIAGQLLGAPDSGRAIQTLRGALQLSFDELQASASFFANRSPGGVSPWIGGAGFGAASLNLSSVLMLVSTLGQMLAIRVVLAALLMAGPAFIGMFLFEATRGVFIGWLRAVIGLAIAPMFAMLALVLQLSLLEPHLADLTALRASGELNLNPAPAIAVLVVTLTTGLVALAGLFAAVTIGLGLRLPFGRKAATAGAATTSAQAGRDAAPLTPGRVALETSPRLASVAAAASAMERRDSRWLVERSVEGPGRTAAGAGASQIVRDAPVAPGSHHRRSANPSATASSLRRDK